MATPNCLAKEGKYLTFGLGREDYGLEILKVREIIGMMNITAVPQVPTYVKGVINLRGKVIPVIDLRLKFAMPSIETTPETCIIVVNLHEVLIGVVIDKVKEVLDIKQDKIEPPPNFGADVHTDYILGIGKINESVKILLNIEKVLGEDVAIVSQVEGK
ncbi:MAG: purine-binding chemotaxis protein CheW [Candidatus Omnitrophica bacterium]|nr:purine-binding chemotaxis protein CheW [Candidatus Omnitrophota bacterium]